MVFIFQHAHCGIGALRYRICKAMCMLMVKLFINYHDSVQAVTKLVVNIYCSVQNCLPFRYFTLLNIYSVYVTGKRIIKCQGGSLWSS